MIKSLESCNCAYVLKKILTIRTPETLAVITLRLKQNSFDKGVMHPKDADGIEYNIDPDQAAPLGAV